MTEKAPIAGLPEEVAPGIRRILAPNPSPMTFWGTNTYLIGTDPVLVVDPGPDDDNHLDAIRTAVGRAACGGVLVTHAHRDHSLGARKLAASLRAAVMGYGPPGAGRSATMERLAQGGLIAGGEGVDETFFPDTTLRGGDRVACGGAAVYVIETPGHFAGHLSFAVGDAILSGDLVMGWASTLISPPDGDLGQFLASCATLKARAPGTLLPGHGPAVTDPAARIDWLVAHRQARTEALLTELAKGPAQIPELARRIYTDTDPALLPAAERNVLAHLIELQENSRVSAEPEIAPDALYRCI